MKKTLALFATVLAAVLNAATPSTSLVYVDTTARTLTGNIVAGNNTTISASGNGTITATAAPVSGLTGLGSGVGTFLATPSSANLASAVTGETGSGALVFATSPTLVTPVLGAATGTSLTLGSAGVTSNIFSVSGSGTIGNATSGAVTSPQLFSQSWYGAGVVFNNSKTDAPDIRNWAIVTDRTVYGDFHIRQSNALGGDPISAGTSALSFNFNRDATIANSLTVGSNLTVSGTGTHAFAGDIGAQKNNPVFTLTNWQWNGSNRISLAYNVAGRTQSSMWDIVTEQTDGGSLSTDKIRGDLVFKGLTAITSSGTTEKMRLTSEGNLIIGDATSDSGYYMRFTKAVSGTFPRTDKIVFGSQEIANGSAAILGVQTAATGATGYLQFNTTNNGTSSEKMRLTSGGNLGIGTVAPDYLLEVAGTSGLAVVGIKETGVRSWGVRAGAYQSGKFDIADFTAGQTRLAINSSGALQLLAYGAGTLSTDASGNVTASSDSRLKTNVRPFARGLADVVKISPKTFNWTEASGLDTQNDYSGFIAQDVQAAIPEAVYEGKDEAKTLSLNDRTVIAALVNAVKELKAEVDALKAARN